MSSFQKSRTIHKSITHHSYNRITLYLCTAYRRDTGFKTCNVPYSALCASSQSRFSIRQRRRRVPAIRVSRQWTVPRWAIAPHTNWISLVARAYDRSGNLSARETSRRIDGGEIPDGRGRGRASAFVIRNGGPHGPPWAIATRRSSVYYSRCNYTFSGCWRSTIPCLFLTFHLPGRECKSGGGRNVTRIVITRRARW